MLFWPLLHIIDRAPEGKASACARPGNIRMQGAIGPKGEDMKKVIVIVLTLAMVLAFAACGNRNTKTGTDNKTGEDVNAKGEGVMTYDEYVAADLDSEVTVETYVQAKQGWWEDNGKGQATIYTQDGKGGYFIYNMPMSEDDYNKLKEGTKIKVTGFKSEWSGEIEITDASFEIEEGSYVADPVDLTGKLGDGDLIDYQNQKFSVTGLEVLAASDGTSAFTYSWDGSGKQGDDLYFNVSDGKNTYSFTVESYLCGADTDVYKAVEGLKVGNKIDVEGFLYWYEGVNPHITSVTVK